MPGPPVPIIGQWIRRAGHGAVSAPPEEPNSNAEPAAKANPHAASPPCPRGIGQGAASPA
jgi:hypothetical protein